MKSLQNKLKPSDDPVIDLAEIDSKKQTVDTLFHKLMSKPKPVPPPA